MAVLLKGIGFRCGTNNTNIGRVDFSLVPAPLGGRQDSLVLYCFFFFNDTATTEIYTLSYTLSLHDALPIYSSHIQKSRMPSSACDWSRSEEHTSELQSHSEISYAVS